MHKKHALRFFLNLTHFYNNQSVFANISPAHKPLLQIIRIYSWILTMLLPSRPPIPLNHVLFSLSSRLPMSYGWDDGYDLGCVLPSSVTLLANQFEEHRKPESMTEEFDKTCALGKKSLHKGGICLLSKSMEGTNENRHVLFILRG